MFSLFSTLVAELLLREGFLIHSVRLCCMHGLGLCVCSKHGMNTRLMEIANHSRDGAGGAARGLCLETLTLVQTHHDVGSALPDSPHDAVTRFWLRHLCSTLS